MNAKIEVSKKSKDPTFTYSESKSFAESNIQENIQIDQEILDFPSSENLSIDSLFDKLLTWISEIKDSEAVEKRAGFILSYLSEPGAKIVNQLLDKKTYLETLETLIKLKKNQIFEKLKNFEWLKSFNLLETHKIGIILQSQNEYPEKLNELYDNRPIVLYYQGNLLLLNYPEIVGIVGTRNATNYGKESALNISRELSVNSIPTISGGALGIDTFVLQGSIGKSIMVLAKGLNEWNRHNSELVKDNLDQGGLNLSEVPPLIRSYNGWFLLRNRIIACLASTVVIIEAGYRSGSLNTAEHAIKLNRFLGAVPGNIDLPLSYGPNNLIANRKAELILGANDLLQLIGIFKNQNEGNSEYEVTENEQLVRETLSKTKARNIESIIQLTKLELFEVMKALSNLEANGKIIKLSGGYCSI